MRFGGAEARRLLDEKDVRGLWEVVSSRRLEGRGVANPASTFLSPASSEYFHHRELKEVNQP